MTGWLAGGWLAPERTVGCFLFLCRLIPIRPVRWAPVPVPVRPRRLLVLCSSASLSHRVVELLPAVHCFYCCKIFWLNRVVTEAAAISIQAPIGNFFLQKAGDLDAAKSSTSVDLDLRGQQ